jgi:molybdate transport system ATP-binding protein
MNFLSVELEGVDLTRGDTRVLRDVNWRVRPGERWALVGHNGAGKTQLLKLLAGDVWPTPSRGAQRRYRVGVRRVDQPAEIKEHIAYLGAERQDKYARYGWNLTVEELIGTGLFATDIVLQQPDRRGRRAVEALLMRFGLRALASRRILTLSYGERRLALIARALAARPRLLLLDEVFNGLDAARRALLMRVLDRSRVSRLPWVLAAHRVEDIPSSVTHLLALDRGRVKYAGRMSRSVLRDALGAGPDRKARVDSAIRSRRPKSDSAPRIELRDADVFVDHQPVLHGITWTIRSGEQWAVLGRNGCGKSTLLKLLYGDLSPAFGGVIERAGLAPGAHIEGFKRQVGFLSPELQSDHARDDLSVADIVISGRHASIGLNEPPTAADRRAVRRWLEFFGLTDWTERRPHELSYGQMRRVLLARAMANSPQLLLLDEPCTGLDTATRAVVLAHLEHLAEAGVQLVMATHHADDVIPAIDHVLRLSAGRIVAIEQRNGAG